MGVFAIKFLVILLVTVAGLFFVSNILNRRREKRLQVFRAREGQAREVFLSRCNISSETEQARIAMGIRETLADLGNISAELLHAEDRFDQELEPLAFCHQFYITDFADLLAEKTGVKLSEEQMELPHLDVPPRGMTVADFVQRILTAAHIPV